jgi:hypothetical protein
MKPELPVTATVLPFGIGGMMISPVKTQLFKANSS